MGTSKTEALLKFVNENLGILISKAEATENAMLPNLMRAHLKINQRFHRLEAETLLKEALLERQSSWERVHA